MRGDNRQPILWFLLPLVLGLISCQFVSLPLVVVGGIAAFLLLAILLWRKIVIIYPIIFCVGYIMASLNTSQESVEAQKATIMTLKVGSENQGTILAQRSGDDLVECHHKVMVWDERDLSHSTLLIEGDIVPLDETSSRYNRTMLRKGFSAGVVVRRILEHDAIKPPLSTQLNHWALNRLEQLNLNYESHALASAIALAYREELPKATVENYNKSGAGHLLALSGLHIGVVLLLISAITYFAPLLRGGHIVADVVSLLFIWLFALMAGMGESVMRATWMFSLLKLSQLLSRRYNSLNSIFVAVVVILSFDPTALYDLGFLLSVIAVAAIITVGVPLTFAVRSGHFLLDFVSTSLIIGLVATLATAPLVIYAFGGFALLSPLVTMPLLLTTSLIIICSLLAILCPLPPFGFVIEVAASLQNRVVEWFASLDWGYIRCSFSDFDLAISYLFLGLFAFLCRWVLVELGTASGGRG